MKKSIAIVLAVAAGTLAPVAAQAGNVYWSIGINAPPIGTVISNAPVYAPVYSQPAPVYYPAPVVYPAPVYVRPAPVVVAPSYVVGGWQRVEYRPPEWRRWNYEQRRHWEERESHRSRRHDRHDHHDEYGDRHGDGRWAPVPADPRRYRHD